MVDVERGAGAVVEANDRTKSGIGSFGKVMAVPSLVSGMGRASCAPFWSLVVNLE